MGAIASCLVRSRAANSSLPPRSGGEGWGGGRRKLGANKRPPTPTAFASRRHIADASRRRSSRTPAEGRLCLPTNGWEGGLAAPQCLDDASRDHKRSPCTLGRGASRLCPPYRRLCPS